MVSGDVLIPRLREFYREMDAVYRAASEQVGFTCVGCDGTKCCTVDVTLHTFIEMFYLRRGFNTLDISRQLTVLGRCRAIVQAKEDDPFGEAYRNSVCALNFDGLCCLYEYRPMICRLAGIPHIIQRPDGKVIESCGCSRYENDNFDISCAAKIDRTVFYRKMAEIEIQVVRAAGKRTKSRTVAETLGVEDPDNCFP